MNVWHQNFLRENIDCKVFFWTKETNKQTNKQNKLTNKMKGKERNKGKRKKERKMRDLQTEFFSIYENLPDTLYV